MLIIKYVSFHEIRDSHSMSEFTHKNVDYLSFASLTKRENKTALQNSSQR